MGAASDRIELTHELSGGRRVGRGFMMRCITHDDSKASLHLVCRTPWHARNSWVRTEKRAGRIPSVRLGKHVRFNLSDIERVVTERQREDSPPVIK
jgi:hypothetical protein